MPRSHEKLITTIITVSLLLAVSLGCGRITEKLKEQAEKIEKEGEPGISNVSRRNTAGGEDEGLIEKTNLYISKCVNQYSNSIMNSYRRYTSWLSDPKTGPTGNERLVYGLYEVRGDGTDCETAIKQAAEIEPKMETVEQTAEKYVAALKEAAKQVKAIYPYYNQNDYKDDKFEKGKAAHGPLMAAFAAFETANKDFTLEVDKLEDEVANRRLEQYRDDATKKFAFTVTDFGIKAKKAMVYVSRNPYKELSADTLQTHADEIEKAITAMKDAVSDNALAGTYMSNADKYLKAVKDLMRRVRDNKPFSSMDQRWLGTGSGWMVEGSPDKVVHEYNSLVRSRSFLRL
ncbi:YiiG family protein [Leptolyngbya sp. 7M]|uniref:YiiG family protein n=1 Tax=Leptolyngbya sp. 7M TaxID=2812896 RepID=UPI001B8BB106|nr:YiiG family protein [Leptolyngbya sp. 7M]QYO65833.1 YiiG family protein [Leptolyngbya sp. 7M]